jgi:hypothetical protein
MKRAEPTSIYVKVRQLGLQGQSATVRVTARQQSGATDGGEIEVGEKTIPLNSSLEFIEFPFTPEDAGRFQFTARAEVLDGEVLEENNQAVRSVNIVDDFLRLQYVAHEPNWEWRFVKEVFHRDKLVGMEGFRTFLASSDPRVRQSNVLFAPTLTPSRKEFFQSDVIFLGDMPREAISDRFAEMVQEFVGNLGGGLVVISGPRFGPQALIGTPLADMLPVKLDPDSSIQDDREFRMELSPHAARYAFMQLGDNATEQQRAWDNLGRLPWRQPVAAVHEQAVVLAEHPSARCRDGKTPQPIIAIRPYGRGEVCFLAFDEMWRLRRRFGEKYYRAFWSKLIYRLGMSHDLGPDKRFVPALDRQKYRSGDRVVLTVDAYDENYDPLQEEDLPNRALTAELTTPVDGGGATARNLPIPFLRSGLFEARIPVFAAGEYVLRIDDPVTGRQHERRFEVTEVSAERRRATRDAHLQTELARKSGGQAYDLATVEGLVDDIRVEPTVERLTRNHPLWTTPLWFVLVVGLMLSEWLFRKLNHLA